MGFLSQLTGVPDINLKKLAEAFQKKDRVRFAECFPTHWKHRGTTYNLRAMVQEWMHLIPDDVLPPPGERGNLSQKPPSQGPPVGWD